MVRQMKTKKIDTSEFESLLTEIKTKGEECIGLTKQADVDQDTMLACLQELEDMAQSFTSQANEELGIEESMPWEQGGPQVKTPTFSQDLQRFIPQKQKNQEFQGEGPNDSFGPPQSQNNGGF